MKQILLIISLLFPFFSLLSQNKEITGIVKDNLGSLSSVVITITTDDESDVISYAVTDSEGRFVIKNVDLTKAKFIRARLMGYAPQAKSLVQNKTDYSFLLSEESIQLNEVMIKAAKISGVGDTTRYLASSFAKENDITLGDVIKRMPGFQVTDIGTIKYQGKEISDFYVEGSNIMGSRYSVAVNSINQVDVGSVEVIENHQSIKLFEDLLFSDKTAVNITLKEKAKNRWVGLLNVGGGIPNQWSNDINAMRFAKKVKMLNTYKCNNTGNDVSALGKPVFNLSDETEEDAREIIQMRSMRNPFLEEQKTLFNKSHLLSLNSQILLSKAFVLTPQLDLGRATFDNNIWEEKNYFLPNGETTTISTHEKGLQKQWDINPTIRVEANTSKVYLNNILTSNFVHKGSEVDITGTYPNSENGKMDYVNIHNTLNVMFRIGQKVVGIKSVNSWRQRPQEIQIKQNDKLIDEKIRTSAFNSQTSTSQSFVIGRSTLSLEEGYSFSQQLLKSTLTGISELSYQLPFENDFDYRNAVLYVKPSLSSKFGSVRTSLSLSANFNYNIYTNHRTDKIYPRTKWLLSPSSSIVWTVNNKFTLSANAGWRQLPESSNTFYSSPLLTSYPFTRIGLLEYQNSETANIGASIRYKNILDGLFWNASYNKMWRKNDLMYTQSFDDTYIVSGLMRNPNTTKSENILASISYMLDFLKGGASLRGVLSNSDSYFMQNDVQQYSVSKMKQLQFNVYSSPFEQLNIDYTFSFINNSFMLKGQERERTNTMHQKLMFTVIPAKKLSMVIIGNHYLNTLESGKKNTFLLDADLNFRQSSKWSFRLSAKNIFNQKEFVYFYYTDMMSMQRQYKIRPFSMLFSVITSI